MRIETGLFRVKLMKMWKIYLFKAGKKTCFFKLMIPRLIDCVVQSIKNEIVCNLLNIMKTFFGRSQLKNETVYKKNVNINLSLSLSLSPLNRLLFNAKMFEEGKCRSRVC